MKRIPFIMLVLVLAGCALLGFLGASSGKITTSSAFDLDNGKEIALDAASLDGADLVLEPWWKDGSPAPALQMFDWGETATLISDLGRISIDDALTMSDDDLVPDSIVWDVYIEKEHTYYVITAELNEYFVYVKTIEIDQQDNSYDAEVTFDYKKK